MGKQEQQYSAKVLKGLSEGKQILVSTRQSILDFILYPYRAYKQKKRREEIRKSLFQSTEPVVPVSDEVKNNWVYKAVAESDKRIVSKSNWVDELVSEDDTKNKGE